MKPIKLGSVADVYSIGIKRLIKMVSKKRFTIKIKNGVSPDETARIFRVLGSRIDDVRAIL